MIGKFGGCVVNVDGGDGLMGCDGVEGNGRDIEGV